MTVIFPLPLPDEATQARTVEWFDLLSTEEEQIKLINEGICLEATEDSNTPLHIAVLQEFKEAVKALLARNVSVNAENIEKRTPLHMAAADGYAGIVNDLLEYGANLEARDHEGFTPLHDAANMLQPEIMNALLEHGANVEARDDENNTPVHYVVGSTQEEPNLQDEAIKVLLARGANVYVVNGDDEAPIEHGSVEEFTEPSLQLYEAFAGEGTPPKSAEQVYQLLSVWPLVDPKAYVDRASHLRQMFRHAKWESPEQAAAIVAQLRERGESAGLCASLQALVSPSLQTTQGRSR